MFQDCLWYGCVYLLVFLCTVGWTISSRCSQRRPPWRRVLHSGEIDFVFITLNASNAVIVSVMVTRELLLGGSTELESNEPAWPLLHIGASQLGGSDLACSPAQHNGTVRVAGPLLAYLAVETTVFWSDVFGIFPHPQWRSIGRMVTPFHAIIVVALVASLTTDSGCVPFMWCAWSEVSTLFLDIESLIEKVAPSAWAVESLWKHLLLATTTLSFLVQRIFVFAAVLAQSLWVVGSWFGSGKTDAFAGQRMLMVVLLGAALAMNVNVTRTRVLYHWSEVRIRRRTTEKVVEASSHAKAVATSDTVVL